MSVVGSDFEDLKQYNLAEIFDPTPKPDSGKSNAATSTIENGKANDESTTEVAGKSDDNDKSIPNQLQVEDKELASTAA